MYKKKYILLIKVCERKTISNRDITHTLKNGAAITIIIIIFRSNQVERIGCIINML